LQFALVIASFEVPWEKLEGRRIALAMSTYVMIVHIIQVQTDRSGLNSSEQTAMTNRNENGMLNTAEVRWHPSSAPPMRVVG
jgi:hypothetical protein